MIRDALAWISAFVLVAGGALLLWRIDQLEAQMQFEHRLLMQAVQDARAARCQ